MRVDVVNGPDAMAAAMKRVESFLDDGTQTVFQILGFFGIGKRTALRDLLKRRGVSPVDHAYTNMINAKQIAKLIKEHPDSVHLWDDVFRSNIMHPDVIRFFKDLMNRGIKFNGKFLLVANDVEFPGYEFPDLPGVHIALNKEETMTLVVKRMRDRGKDDASIRRAIRNLDAMLS